MSNRHVKQRYADSRTQMYPGDVLEITAKGTTKAGERWEASADLHFVGWAGPRGSKHPVLHLVEFDSDGDFIASTCCSFHQKGRKECSRPVHVAINSPLDASLQWVLVEYIWRYASKVSAEHVKRGQGWRYHSEP